MQTLKFRSRASCAISRNRACSSLRSSASRRSEELRAALPGKLERIGLRSIVVTMGAQGSVFARIDGQSGWCPAHVVEVVDTAGAGDAFFAGVAVGLTYGKGLGESCAIGAKLAASTIASEENVCGRFSLEELGLAAR